MAILIDLERQPYASLQTEIDTRIDVGLQALQFYMHGFFKPKTLDIWEKAPLTELDGALLDSFEINITDFREIKKKIGESIQKRFGNNYNALQNTIIRVNGNWQLNGSNPKGFFSINNSTLWKKVYGDIDADISPDEEEVDDLMILFWKDTQSRNSLVDKFFENFLSNYDTYNFKARMKLNWICFASDVPSKYDVSTIRAAYYGGLKSLIRDAFETFREKHKDVQKSLMVKYIVDTAYQEPIFKHSIIKALEKFRIRQNRGHSVILIGEKFDSFNNLYNEFSSEFLDPLFKKLPKDEEVNKTIKEVITKHKPLSDYDLNKVAEYDEAIGEEDDE